MGIAFSFLYIPLVINGQECTPGDEGCCDTMMPPSIIPPEDSSCWLWWESPQNGVLTDNMIPLKGCDYRACQDAVCACDSYCCDTAWDKSCRGYEQEAGGSKNNFFASGCSAKILCCEPPQSVLPSPDDNTSFQCNPDSDEDCCASMVPPSFYPPRNSTCWDWWDTPMDGILPPDVEPTKGCDYQPCQDSVCACDSYCCDTAWDRSCRGYFQEIGKGQNNYFEEGCSAKILCCERSLLDLVVKEIIPALPIVSNPAPTMILDNITIPVPAPLTVPVPVPVPVPVNDPPKIIEVPLPVTSAPKVVEIPLPVSSAPKVVEIPVPVPASPKVIEVPVQTTMTPKIIPVPLPVPQPVPIPVLLPVPVPVPVQVTVPPKVIPVPLPVPLPIPVPVQQIPLPVPVPVPVAPPVPIIVPQPQIIIQQPEIIVQQPDITIIMPDIVPPPAQPVIETIIVEVPQRQQCDCPFVTIDTLTISTGKSKSGKSKSGKSKSGKSKGKSGRRQLGSSDSYMVYGSYSNGGSCPCTCVCPSSSISSGKSKSGKSKSGKSKSGKSKSKRRKATEDTVVYRDAYSTYSNVTEDIVAYRRDTYPTYNNVRYINGIYTETGTSCNCGVRQTYNAEPDYMMFNDTFFNVTGDGF